MTRSVRDRAGISALIGLYVLGSALSTVIAVNPTDLDAFFLPSARLALEGHPLHVYAVRHEVVYPNANGPLSLLPLTAIAALASVLGWLEDLHLRRALVMAAFSIVALLLAREATLLIDRLRGHRTAGRPRLLLYAAFALPPLLWHSVLLYGHIEQPLCLWLTLRGLRALREDRPGWAGLCLGLAALSRTVAVLYALPLAVMLAAGRRWRGAAAFSAATLLTVAAGLLPFLIADRGDTVFSLVTFHGGLPIAGGSIWELAIGTPLEWWGQHADGALVLLSSVAIACAAVGRRPRLVTVERDVVGLLVLAALCFPLLAKTVWPYYLLDAYVFSTAWAFGRLGPWRSRGGVATAAVPVVVSLCGFAAEAGVNADLSLGWRRLESAAMFATLLAVGAGLSVALLRRYGRGTGVGSEVAGADGGAAGTEAGGAAADAAGAVGTAPDGAGAAGTDGTTGALDAPGGAGVEVGPRGGVGQLASAGLKGVGDGLGVGDAPAEGTT